MPTDVEHFKQAKSNTGFLTAIQRDPASQHPDWVITVAFYIALHLVEAKFARDNMHCADHSERGQKVAQRLSAISGKYLRLYTESRAARYECREINPARAQDVLQKLYAPVRDHLCRALGMTL